MYLGLRSVMYPVDNLAAAGRWYEKVFDKAPTLLDDTTIGFEVGHDRVWLTTRSEVTPGDIQGASAFWAVSDIDREFLRLQELGATPMQPPLKVSGEFHQAKVTDPFGNIFGIVGLKADPLQSTIDDQASRTALWTTLMRAFSQADSTGMGCEDRLARFFLLPDQQAALDDLNHRSSYMEKFFVVGVYEYVTARTHIFDTFFKEAMDSGFEQIVLLGAGYDSRAYRFAGELDRVRVFEVDAPKTQARKKDCLAQAGIPVPEQVSFVPLNFNTGSLIQALKDAGFDSGKKTFFSWEGVTFYIFPDAVDATLDCIKTHAPRGSTVAFDYIELWPGIFDAFGVKELIAFNRKHQSGESGNRFALEQGQISAFLGDRGFEISDFLDTKDIEDRLKQQDKGFSGNVTASFRIVRARTSPGE
ncbi:MAG: SAM-dependent methyltransferase [Desulfobacter sp.]|nr:MAG: SAM-dependent methyltransferase [Desulfobacter sp.]